jgi:RNA polymerase sigma-70 factor (ECF subfamily)
MNAFYASYHKRVFLVARSIVGDDWDAEEVTQDVFWTVYRKIDLFHDDKSLWSWTYRISVNAAKMKVRKNKRCPIPFQEKDLLLLSNKTSTLRNQTTPDQQFACQELASKLNNFLKDSGEVNRKVYMYMDILGLPKEVAAANLDMTVSALKSRLHRIRFAMRSELTALSA